MPLQDRLETFLYMQVWQMASPHRQVQQNDAVWPQQWHTRPFARRRRSRRTMVSFIPSSDWVIKGYLKITR
jgi:hypothetical protein